MKLEFLSIKVKNFRSYGNVPTQFDFSNGVDLITGTNGNGKTSLIMHGIIFGLFGDGVNGEKVNDLINDINKKNMEVQIELLSNDVYYRIVRGRKPNFLKVFINESEEPEPSISSKADDDYVVDMILGGIEKNTFLKLFTIQANDPAISIFRMNSTERRKILESLFDLTVYSEMKKQNNDNINSIMVDKLSYERANKGLDSTLVAHNSTLTSTNKFIKTLNERLKSDSIVLKDKAKEIKSFDVGNDKKVKSKKLELSKLEEQSSKVSIFKKTNEKKANSFKKDGINKVISTVDLSINSINKNVKDLNEKKESLLLAKKDSIITTTLDEKKKNLESNKIKVSKNEKEISSIDAKFKTEKEFIANIGECAKGNQEFIDCVKKKYGSDKISEENWKDQVKPDLNKKIEELKNLNNELEKEIKLDEENTRKIQSIEKDIKKISSDIMLDISVLKDTGGIKKDINISNFEDIWESKKTNFIKAKDELDLDSEKIDEVIKTTNDINKDIKILKEEIKILEKDSSDSLTKDHNNIEKSIDKTKLDIKTNKVDVSNVKKEISKIKNGIKKNLEDIKALEEDILSKTELNKFLKDEKIKFFIIKQSFPILKKEFNIILKKLFYGEIRVNIDNNFEISVYKNGEKQNFEAFSEGEKKRLDLGFIFTIHEFLSQKNQLSVNILIMDELLDSALDSAGTDNVIDYLNEIKTTRNVILVTHRDENIEHDRRFVVSKDKKFSSIEEI